MIDSIETIGFPDITPELACEKAKLMAQRTEIDGFRVRGLEIYWWRSKKPGTSLFSIVPPAKVLREPFTIRSTTTIRKLLANWP